MGIKTNSKREIILISGQRDAGKTKLCLNLILQLKSANRTIKGMVSPGLYKEGRKIGILAHDIASGEEKQFAKYSLGWDIKRPEREWRFLSRGIKWANEKIKNSVPTDIFLIDEIGYLEIEEEGGWTAALKNLDEGSFNHAILVIRPDLLGIAQARWKIREIVMVEQGDDLEELARQIIDYLVDKA